MSVDSTATELFTAGHLLSQENLARIDETLHEIFGMMLGVEIHSERCATLSGTAALGMKRATVNFAGTVCGSCEICMDGQAVLALTSAMLGDLPAQEFEESMCDAVGELCNMITGGWKNRVPSLESCSLKPPAVCSVGCGPADVSNGNPGIQRCYVFDTHGLRLTLLLEDGVGSAAGSFR